MIEPFDDEPGRDGSAEDDGVPSYPSRAKSTPVQVSRELHLRAWIGTRANLERLVDLLQDSLKKLYDEHVRELPADIHRVDAARRILESLTVVTSVEAKSGAIERSGGLDEILAEVDFRDIRGVRIRNDGHYKKELGIPTVDLRIKNGGSDRWAVQLEVTGLDRQWVGGMFDTLSAELKARVPGWTFLRDPKATIIIGSLLTTAFYVWRYAGSPDDQQNDPGVYLTFALVCAVGGAVVSGVLLFPLLNFLVRPFELLGEGERPRSLARLTAVGGVISFLLGLAGLVLAL